MNLDKKDIFSDDHREAFGNEEAIELKNEEAAKLKNEGAAELKNEEVRQKPKVESKKQTKDWVPYENASNELTVTNWMPKGYYKFRWAVMHPFSIKFPFLRFSIGFVLVFIIIFAAYLAFQIVTILKNKDDEDERVESTGSFAGLMIGFVFMFPTFNSVFMFILGLSFEHQIYWHKFVSVLAFSAATVHSVYGLIENDELASGLPLFIAICVLMITGFFPYFRTKFFNLFFKIHILMVLVIIVFAIIHGSGKTAIFAGVFWGLDVVIRFILYCINRKKLMKARIVRLSNHITMIRFDNNGFRYKEGQFCIFRIPKVSAFDGHPFSLASAPCEKHVTVYIKALGSFTKRLNQKVSTETEVEHSVYVHGPYGIQETDSEGNRFKTFIFIAGGIGVTPLLSRFKQLLNQYSRGRDLKKVTFIWSARELSTFKSILKSEDFDKRLKYYFNEDNKEIEYEPDLVNVDLYLTKEKLDRGDIEGEESELLREKLKTGRPKLDEYFSNIKAFQTISHDASETHLKTGRIFPCWIFLCSRQLSAPRLLTPYQHAPLRPCL